MTCSGQFEEKKDQALSSAKIEDLSGTVKGVHSTSDDSKRFSNNCLGNRI